MVDMKFKSAAKSYANPSMEVSPSDEYFQRLCINLKDFPGLEGELGDTIVITIKAKIVSKEESESCKEQDVEVVSIGVPKNGADETYSAMTAPRLRGMGGS